MRRDASVLLLDAAEKERVRLEDYLPDNDFMAALRNGRIAFVRKECPVISAAKQCLAHLPQHL